MPLDKKDRAIMGLKMRVESLEKRTGLLVQIVKDLALKIYPPEVADEKLRAALEESPTLLEAYDKALDATVVRSKRKVKPTAGSPETLEPSS